jgi:hypothetical protein
MNLEQVSPAFVKPCQNEDITPNSNPVEGVCKSCINLQPGIGRTFPPLFRTAFTRPQGGTYDSDRLEQILSVLHNNTSVLGLFSSMI